mmetsp:Transcript_14205/g.42114  ORF Transcript_14205/g.42114 Transcript_14205/m.42114 type:complete len:1012 (-) Transcript_14205:174-3209(-)
MAAAVEDRLDKKVAQLTKVVVFLNKKNEESQRERGILAQRHEDEVQTILGHARRRLEQFERRMVEIGQPAAVLDALTAKLRTAAQARADEEVARLRQQYREKEEEHADQLRLRTDEVAAVRQQAAAMQRRLAEAIDAAATAAKGHAAVAAAEKQAEIDQLSASQAQLTQELKVLQAERDTLRARAEAAEAAHTETAGAARELAKARQVEEELRSSIAHVTSRASATEGDLTTAQTRVSELEQQLAAAQQAATDHTSAHERVSSQLGDTKVAMLALEQEHSRRAAEDLNNLRSRESEIEMLKQKLAEHLGARDAENDRLREKLDELGRCHSDKVNRLETTLHDVKRSSATAVVQAKAKSKETQALLTAELEAARAETDRVRSELEASLEKETANLAQRHSMQLREFRNAWDRDRRVMVEQHKAELAAATASASVSVDAQLAQEHVSRLEHELRISTARAAELEAASTQATARLAAAQERAERAEAELATRLVEADGVRQAHEGARDQLDAALADAQAKEAAARAEKDSAAVEVLQLRRDLASAQASLAQAEATITQLRDSHAGELTELERQHESLVASKIRDLEAKHHDARTSMEAKVDELHTQVRRSAADLEAAGRAADEREQHKLSELEARLLREAEEHEASRVSDALASAETASLAAARQELERECATRDDEIAALQRALSDAREEGEMRLSNASADAAARLQAQLELAAEKAAAAVAQLKEMHKADLDRAEAEATAAVATAKAAAENELTAQEQSWQERIRASIHKSRTSAMSEAQAEAARRAAETDEAHAAQVAALQGALEAAQGEVAEAVAAKDAALRQADECEAESTQHTTRIEALVSELEAKGEELLAQRREMSVQLDSARAESAALVEQNKSAMEKLVNGYVAQIDELKDDLRRSEETSKTKLAIFEEEFRKAELEFTKRKSLPEDRDRISQLEGKLATTLKKAQQLAKLNKQYALEVRQQDKTMHTMLKGDQPKLALGQPLPSVGGKATFKRRGPRGSGLPK